MNDLRAYLIKYFPNGAVGEFEGKTADISEHFFDRFGVMVKIQDDRFMFKYDMLAVKFSIPLTKFCRGHIYQHKNGVWRCICNAMDKFWNWDESYSPICENSFFQKYINQTELKTKEDGSLMHLYFYEGEWVMSTSGSIIPFFVSDSQVKFDELFWQTVKLDKATFLSKLDKDYTYIFELCSALNAIVSMYSTERVYLLNIRHTEYGTYVPINDLANELQVLVPKSTFLYELGINTLENLILWVEKNCVDDADCKYKEGFVAYINGVPAAKIKSAKYKFLHSFKGSNDKETRNNIIDAFFTDALDDVYNSLHDNSKLFVETLRLKVLNMIKDVNNVVNQMKSMTFATQKDYALFVLANAPKMVHTFFFQNKEIILKGEYTQEMFSMFLKKNYAKYTDYWKS